VPISTPSTPRAILTRVRGVQRHKLATATGPCCLVRPEGSKLTPRRVSDALGETLETLGMPQPIHREEFPGEQSESQGLAI
jgi:hypothetical protein